MTAPESRLAILSYEDLDEAQRRVHDDILAGPRSAVGGPMNAWFRSSELAQLSQRLGAFCRYHTSLPPRLSELAILTVARHWTAQPEWCIHKPIALDAGVPAAVVDAIEARRDPAFGDRDDAAMVHRVTRELLETKTLGDGTYGEALALFGEKTLVELVAIIGYYSSVAMVLNAFAVPVPTDRDKIAAPMAP